MSEIRTIKEFLNRHTFEHYSISQICDHLNYLKCSKKYNFDDVIVATDIDIKKYTVDDVLSFLSCYENSKYLNSNSYINYRFLDGRIKKINNGETIENSDKKLNGNKFIQFKKIFYEEKLTLICFFSLFFMSSFFPNFFLILFLMVFFYLVNKLFPIANIKIGVPIFLGLYPFVYGVFNYSEYISKEFSFLIFIQLFPKKMVLFDEKIDLMYLNYLTLAVSFYITSIILFLKAVFNYNRHDGVDVLFVFIIVFIGFVGQNILYYSSIEDSQSSFSNFLYIVKTLNIFPFVFAYVILNKFMNKLDNSFCEKKINLLFICSLFFIVCLTFFHSGKNLTEHYYSTINIPNKDNCSNIDENFKIIKSSKKTGFVVIDSQSFNENDIYNYIHFNSNMKLKHDFLMNHKNETFNNYTTYNKMIDRYSNELKVNNTKEEVNKKITPENKISNKIIEHYINLNSRNRFFYYKCE